MGNIPGMRYPSGGVNRRKFLGGLVLAGAMPGLAATAEFRTRRLLLRSSWQTVNIGDIAHTPGMLALLEKHRPEIAVTLWPSSVDRGVEELLRKRFPRLRIATTAAEKEQALEECDFFLHGSGPGLVGAKEAERARKAGKPYGFGGVTLSDEEIATHRELLAGATFVFCRDTLSLEALKQSGAAPKHADFGPDATFALDVQDRAAARETLARHKLEPGRYLCAVPRLRWTPYWEIHPETRKPDAAKIATNQEFAEKDHAKQREAIVAWVRETKLRVLLAPEMTYAVPLLRPLLFDGLPKDVQPHVAIMDRYWLTAEAASVYAQAAAVVSFEQHSPIMAIANGVPAIYLRQPTDTRKGQMWRDIRLPQWIFEIDQATGAAIAERVVEIGKAPEEARATAAAARAYAQRRMQEMLQALPI